MFKKEKLLPILKESLFYLIIFLFTFFSYIIFKPMMSTIRNGVIAQIFALFCIVITITVMIILKAKNKLTFPLIILFMLLISYFVRLGYMLYTPYNTRQYDTITSNFDGHEGYALTILQTGHLPTSNDYQFYHPPLNAAIQALFMKINMTLVPLLGGNQFDMNDVHQLYQTCQILSVLYSVIISVTGYKIIKQFKLGARATLLAFSFICFFPRLIQLSGQLNNDLLCIMFGFIAIYYAIKWYYNHSYLNTILLAIFIGLAMNTKLSGATICIPIAIIFIMEFIKSIKAKNNVLSLCLKYALFLVICAPIGLWFQIYAKMRFDQPFLYVYDPAADPTLSTADHNIFERIFLFINFEEMFGNIFVNSRESYSLLNYNLKSAIFGEFSYWQGENFAALSVFFNYLFFFASIILFIIYIMRAKKENFLAKFMGLSIVISQALSIIYFYIRMPYGCTMDFRYIVPIIIGFALLMGLCYDKFKEEKSKKSIFMKVTTSFMLAFLLFSNLFYLVCI